MRMPTVAATSATTTQPTKIAVDEREIAALTGLSVSFVQKDRRTRRLLPFYRVGSAIRYSPARVADALRALEEGGAKQAAR